MSDFSIESQTKNIRAQFIENYYKLKVAYFNKFYQISDLYPDVKLTSLRKEFLVSIRKLENYSEKEFYCVIASPLHDF